MIDTPEITRLEAAPTAVIRLNIPRSEMQQAMQSAIPELFSALADQGIEPAGAVFAHHFSMTPDMFDFELGVPVVSLVTPTGRVESSERPDVPVARTIHHGPYEGLPEAWGQFHAWIEDQGLDFASDIWEVYVDGPHSHPDPADWRTELNRPLRNI